MSYMHLFLYMSTVVFLIGLCIGSFLNVVALRGLSGESIAFPASKCPSCQKPLKWWHNIPVISYLFLRGKCAFCKEKITLPQIWQCVAEVMEKHNVQALDCLETAIDADREARIRAEDFIKQLI